MSTVTVLINANIASVGNKASRAMDIICQMDTNVHKVQDNLFGAKIAQAHAVHQHHSADLTYSVGDKVMLSTFHCWCDYMKQGDNR